MNEFLQYYLNRGKQCVQIPSRCRECLDKILELNESIDSINQNLDNINNTRIQALEAEIERLKNILGESSNSLFTDRLGESESKGINQKALTLAFNKVWDKLEELTGESRYGIEISVTPTYFVGDSCNVNISIVNSEMNEIFQQVQFYVNDVLVDETFNVTEFQTVATISDTAEIKCVVKINGEVYEKTKTITKYSTFYMFSGNFQDLNSVMDFLRDHSEYCRNISNGLRGAYDVSCIQGDKIIIVFKKPLVDSFIRADLNGIEILFDREDIISNGEEYAIFTSKNTYNTGTYNIDING